MYFCSKGRIKKVSRSPIYGTTIKQLYWRTCCSGGIRQTKVVGIGHEWCLLADWPKLKSTNRILDILQVAWRNNYSQLVLTVSPLASFIWYPSFQEVIKLDNYGLWQKEGLSRYIWQIRPWQKDAYKRCNIAKNQ